MPGVLGSYNSQTVAVASSAILVVHMCPDLSMHASPLQATQDALVQQLRQFKLSGDGRAVTDGHADMAALQAFSSLLHDASTLFHAAPSAPRHAFLLDLLGAAFASKAPAQAGLAAYLLLGPATSALWDLQLAARGDPACSKKVAALEKELVVHSGSLAWNRLLPRAKSDAGARE